MNLEQHYSLLFQNAIQKIIENQTVKDSMIENPNDNRFGITLLTRPDKGSIRNIQTFLNQLKAIDPTQYYYPASDIHLTIMSLISCYSGFNLEKIYIEDYIEMVRESLKDMTPFSIYPKGITASPSCIMIQGFPENNKLNDIRNQLRENFKNGNLEHSIDKRYTLQTAHNTVVRFKNPIQNKDAFLELLYQYRDFDFGTYKINSLELVFNDWYQRKNKVKTLHHFTLNEAQKVI